MQNLQQLNIKVQPLSSCTPQQVEEFLQLIVQSFKAESPLVKFQIQSEEKIRENTRNLIPKILKAEQIFNKQKNTNISFPVRYTLDGRLISSFLTCDLYMFLKVMEQGNIQNFYIDFLKKIAQVNKMGEILYFSTGAIIPNIMKLGMAKYFIAQRCEYFLSKGYRTGYTLVSHPGLLKMYINVFGCKKGQHLILTDGEGKPFELPLIIFDFSIGLLMYKKSTPRL